MAAFAICPRPLRADNGGHRLAAAGQARQSVNMWMGPAEVAVGYSTGGRHASGNDASPHRNARNGAGAMLTMNSTYRKHIVSRCHHAAVASREDAACRAYPEGDRILSKGLSLWATAVQSSR
jgi:hypothetical protein